MQLKLVCSGYAEAMPVNIYVFFLSFFFLASTLLDLHVFTRHLHGGKTKEKK